MADTMITNMPYEDITSLVKMQLSDMSGWNITSYSVTGYGGTEECVCVPAALSSLQPADRSKW